MQFSQQPRKGIAMTKKSKSKSTQGPKLLPDKKNAPKKSGKSRMVGGVKPLDPEADFGKPVREEGPDETPVQGELITEPVKPVGPAIQHGKIAMHFVGYRPKRSKDRDKIVHMDFSLELTEEHQKRLPREIEDAWHELERNKYNFVGPDGNTAQKLSFFLVPDSSEPDMETVATLSFAEISRIAERGKGAERKITRLSMRFVANFTKDVDEFCMNAYDETVFVKIKAAQRRLDEQEED